MIRASREFNEFGYNWYAQIWVESYNLWADLSWMRIKFPAGFKQPNDAIRIAQENM